MSTREHHRRTTARTVTGAVALALAIGITLLWSWNTVAADLFHAPRAEFKHAFAFELAFIALGSLAAACGRMGRRAPNDLEPSHHRPNFP